MLLVTVEGLVFYSDLFKYMFLFFNHPPTSLSLPSLHSFSLSKLLSIILSSGLQLVPDIPLDFHQFLVFHHPNLASPSHPIFFLMNSKSPSSLALFFISLPPNPYSCPSIILSPHISKTFQTLPSSFHLAFCWSISPPPHLFLIRT